MGEVGVEGGEAGSGVVVSRCSHKRGWSQVVGGERRFQQHLGSRRRADRLTLEIVDAQGRSLIILT